ncbi:MAG: ABC transporter permease [Pseudoxanthomonas sp.]
MAAIDSLPLRRARRRALPSGLRAVATRLGSGLLVLWAVITLAFLGVYAVPGDTVQMLIGENPATPELVAAVRAEWGLDRPLSVQYLHYLWRVLHGDFGRSYVLKTDVAALIRSQLPATLELTAAAAVVALLLAVAVAVGAAGSRRGGRIATQVELVVAAIPTFWLGIVLLFVFSFTLRWFPVSGADGLSALVLPAFALGLPLAAVIGQVLRKELERALEQPFALSVRAWGVGGLQLRLRHGLRHAALPAVSLGGWMIGGLIGMAVITEQVFGRPGLGRILVSAVQQKDLPVVLAVAVISALVYVVTSTLADLAYLWIDPRLRDRQTRR